MCRLMLFNRQFAIEHSEAEMADVFNKLNTIQGGHGMGLFLSGPNKLVKGTKLHGKDLARVLYKSLRSKTPFDYAMFHCRLAGPAGSICDENTQPYWDEDDKIALAHNGVASEFCNSKYDYSDTELLLRVLCDYGIPIRNLEYYSGVFIGINQGVPFVVKGAEWTDLELLYHEETNAWCFMSIALYPLTKKPYEYVKIKHIVWQGHEVDKPYLQGLIDKDRVERYTGSYQIHRDGEWQTVTTTRNKSFSEMTDAEWTQYEQDAAAKDEDYQQWVEKIDRQGYVEASDLPRIWKTDD